MDTRAYRCADRANYSSSRQLNPLPSLETEQRFSLAFPMARVTLAIIAELGRERQKFHPLKRMQ